MSVSTVALIGFGEVGQVLAADLPASLTVQAFDINPSKITNAGRTTACHSAAVAAKTADLVISAVTAAQTLSAAESVADSLKAGAWFMDLNSSSPEAKIAAADVIHSAGGRYVEVAIMSPIEPKRLS